MKTSTIMLVFLGVMTLASGCNKEDENIAGLTGHSTSVSPSRSCQFRADMRKLWEDHIVYTRNVICCLVDDLPGSGEALTRLMRNQMDIGDAIRPYYGDEAGTELTRLLEEHITIAGDVILAAKNGNEKALDIANQKWIANADEIASFLSGANPYWEEHELKMMLHNHLELTTSEVVARLNRDYQADIQAYDAVHTEALSMSDMIANGIILQFPDRF